MISTLTCRRKPFCLLLRHREREDYRNPLSSGPYFELELREKRKSNLLRDEASDLLSQVNDNENHQIACYPIKGFLIQPEARFKDLYVFQSIKHVLEHF